MTTRVAALRGAGPEALLAAAGFLGHLGAILEHVARRAAVLDWAARTGAGPAASDVQAEADAFRRGRRLESAKETEAWLAGIGASLDDLEQEMALLAVLEKRRAAVPSEDVESWLHAHRADLEEVRVSRLRVRGEGLARELLRQVKDDRKDFRLLALRHSIDPAERDAAGYLGRVRRSTFAKREVAARVFGARAGECVGPFPSTPQGSFELFFVHEPAGVAFDEAARARAREALVDAWAARLVREAAASVGSPGELVRPK